MRTLKTVTIVLGLSFALIPAFAQNAAINTDGSLPDPNAILDLKSGNKGLLIPRMSSTARMAIPNTVGLLVYDTSTSSFWYNTGLTWINLPGYKTTIGMPPSGPLKGTNDSAGQLPGGNTAVGLDAMLQSTSGVNNTALGYAALYNNAGDSNTAIGVHTLYFNTGGHDNAAIGAGALYYNSNGYGNVAAGTSALTNNTTGNMNTGMGFVSQFNTSTGGANTSIGSNSMWTNTTGTGNTAIGAGSDVGTSNLTNATAIGYGAVVNASNKIRLGNSAVTVIEGQVPFTTPSDGRYKYNIREDVKGLDFIMKLRPVTYQFDVRRFDTHEAGTDGGINKELVTQAAYREATLIRRSGFIAQEVETAALSSGYDFSGIVRPQTPADHYSLSYESFVVPLVKAVQEQQAQLEQQQRKIESRQRQLDEQENKIAALRAQLEQLL